MNISLSWRSWSFMGIPWQFIFNLFRHPAWWYFSLIVGPQHWPSRETRKYSAKCNIFNPTSLLVSSITMVGLPRLPVMFQVCLLKKRPIANNNCKAHNQNINKGVEMTNRFLPRVRAVGPPLLLGHQWLLLTKTMVNSVQTHFQCIIIILSTNS